MERLHEALCFLRAYPDDAKILADVTAMLACFARRTDLHRCRRALENTGIAGTGIRFSFYAGTARWLAERWGNRLTVDWRAFANREALERVFPLVSLFAETPALDELDLGVRGWVKRLKGPRETDAVFLVRRLAALGRDTFENEWAYEGLDLPLVLAPGPDGPSRTRAAARSPGRELPDRAARRRAARRRARSRASRPFGSFPHAATRPSACSTSRARPWSPASGISTSSSGGIAGTSASRTFRTASRSS